MNKTDIDYALEKAVGDNNLKEVIEIINNYPDIDLNDGDSFVFNPPLYRASEKGFIDICKFLLQKGARINYTKDNSFYPLAGAAAENNIEVVKFLLETGADINAYEITTISAIGYASSKGAYETVKYLIEQGADINRLTLQQYLTPLDLAIIWGKENVVELLKKQGALSNVENNYDWTQEQAGGISQHINNNIGRVILTKFNETENGVFNRLAMVNKDNNILLFSVGNYQYTKPYTEFIMILPFGWNPYSVKTNSVFPYEIMKEITNQIKKGKQFKDGDFISKNDTGFNTLTWLEKLAGFYVVDYNYTEQPDNRREDTVYLYTLIPVQETKSGYSPQSLEKLKSKKWKALELFGLDKLRPIH